MLELRSYYCHLLYLNAHAFEFHWLCKTDLIVFRNIRLKDKVFDPNSTKSCIERLDHSKEESICKIISL